MNTGYKLLFSKHKKLYSYVRGWRFIGFDRSKKNYPVRYIKGKWVQACKNSYCNQLMVFNSLEAAIDYIVYDHSLVYTLSVRDMSGYRVYKCDYTRNMKPFPTSVPNNTVLATKVKLLKKMPLLKLINKKVKESLGKVKLENL